MKKTSPKKKTKKSNKENQMKEPKIDHGQKASTPKEAAKDAGKSSAESGKLGEGVSHGDANKGEKGDAGKPAQAK